MEKQKNDGYEDYEVPKDFDEFKDDLSSRVQGPQDMINPYNKNLYTWVIGILVLTIISIASGGVYLHKQVLDEKNAQIEALRNEKKMDCKEEIKKYIELQRELMNSLNKDESQQNGKGDLSKSGNNS